MLYSYNMQLFDAFVLGLVQGFTEFLPISSTGHLTLVRDWLQIVDSNALAFDAIMHFATTAAVIIYFRKDITVLVSAVFRKLGKLPVNERDMTLVYALLAGTIPGVIFGVLLDDFVSTTLQSPVYVAIILFFASLFFLFAEWRHYLKPQRESINLRKGIFIGLFQTMALLPGFSRSGATIAGGMLLGLSRYEASRFSFLLAIPITLGAGSKKTIDLLQQGGAIDWMPILLGAVVAMITAFIVIHVFLGFIRRHTLWPFIWYGIILSGLVLYVSFLT